MSAKPVSLPALSERDHVRFWSKVTVSAGCWRWTGKCRSTDGRALFSVGRSWFQASRIAWLIVNGDPGEAFLLHTCDDPACVRPSHLFTGTQADNVADMVNKHRYSRSGLAGSANPRSTLTEEQVVTIRATYTGAHGQQSALARQYGVSSFAVWCVVHRRTWKHI